jgi:hypothetical protein
VGAKCVTTRRIGGANRPSTSELTQIDPPRTWGVRGIGGPIRAAVDVLVEPMTGFPIAAELAAPHWPPDAVRLPWITCAYPQ